MEKKYTRARSVRNLYSKKFVTLTLEGIWAAVLGIVEATGCWLIFGKDKNGKTRLALLLAKTLSKVYNVLYISAEEGLSLNLQEVCTWAGIDPQEKNLHFTEEIDLEELKERLRSRKAPKIVFIDNITFYHDILKYGGVRNLMKEFNKTVFIFLAHEEKGEPYTSTAKMVKKLATVILHVEGLFCEVSGRVPGGNIVIDETRAKLYHGNSLKQKIL